MNDTEMQLTSLKDQINKLKTAVDKCFVPSIYVHTYKIAPLVEKMKQTELTNIQKVTFNKLDEKTLEQFERLSKGRCLCKIYKDI